MRAILHSWTDEQCIGILNNIRSAMKLTGRIFVRTSLPARLTAPAWLTCVSRPHRRSPRAVLRPRQECDRARRARRRHRALPPQLPLSVPLTIMIRHGKQAPEPMLPNFGSGKKRAFNMDITMLITCNAKERTLPEMIDVGCVPNAPLFCRAVEG